MLMSPKKYCLQTRQGQRALEVLYTELQWELSSMGFLVLEINLKKNKPRMLTFQHIHI